MGILRFQTTVLAAGMIAIWACATAQTESSEPNSGEVSVSQEKDPGDDSATRALHYLRKEGVAWMDKRGCVSCHQIPSMIWSLSAAQRRGLDVDADELTSWIEWSVKPVNFAKPERKKDLELEEALSANIDTMAALLLAVPRTQSNDWRQQCINALCRDQAENGSWQACGQLPMQKRPKQETQRVTTLWVSLALLHEGQVSGWDQKAAITFADEGSQPLSTEWYAVRLMVAEAIHRGKQSTGEYKTNDVNQSNPGDTDASKRDSVAISDSVSARRDALVEFQNEDGGWGWIAGQPSDALATGLALYAINRAGGGDRDATTRARSFLVDAQTVQGHWKVYGTKKASKSRFTPTSNYWGTAWAVIGLLSETPIAER